MNLNQFFGPEKLVIVCHQVETTGYLEGIKAGDVSPLLPLAAQEMLDNYLRHPGRNTGPHLLDDTYTIPSSSIVVRFLLVFVESMFQFDEKFGENIPPGQTRGPYWPRSPRCMLFYLNLSPFRTVPKLLLRSIPRQIQLAPKLKQLPIRRRFPAAQREEVVGSLVEFGISIIKHNQTRQ